MALAFNSQKGGKQRSGPDSLKMEEENKVRLVGDVLPRYVYWVKGANGKDIPMECLQYDRETETFTSTDMDYVKQYFPDLKCGWAYAMQCIDLKDGRVKVFNLKKKLWEQIMNTAEDLGDPTDPETGWDVIFKKVKTGPSNFNVEYQLQPLKCKKRPLTPEERELVLNLKSMDEIIPRATPDAQKTLLDKITAGSKSDETDDSIDEEFDTE